MDKTSKKTTKSNKNLIIIIVVAVILIIAGIAAFFIINNNNKNDTSDNQDQTSQDSDDDSKTKATLSIGDLSLKYPSDDWSINTENADEETVAIDNGKDSYIMLTYNNGQEAITTEEFADYSVETFEAMNYNVKKDGAQTINGKEWYVITADDGEAWMKILFYAHDDDCYMVSYSADAEDKINNQTAKDILNTLTLK